MQFEDKTVKGEIVIVIAPPQESDVTDTEALLLELMQNMSVSKAAAEAAVLTGNSKRDLYQQALALKEHDET
jgi:16S rRNA (cytidine1402-2'-O)-methyltransferase